MIDERTAIRSDNELTPTELIARWEVEAHDGDQDSLVSRLCRECIGSFRRIHRSTSVEEKLGKEGWISVDRSRHALALWADAYNVTTGGLDAAATKSPYVRRKVLGLLKSIAKALSSSESGS